jgi:transcriptional regulator GlxA family with amidase domain
MRNVPLRPVHVALWLPERFYSAVAATMVEMFELVNRIRREQSISFEFISRHPSPDSTAGISFRVRTRPSRKMDALILLATPGLDAPELVRTLDREQQHANPIIALARRQGALIAAHCGGSYLLAGSGLLEGKRSTISWWLKAEAQRRFPLVRWDASRLLIRQGRLYTSGGGFSGLELARTLLVDLGFEKEERMVRKLMLLPPSRELQSPYEFPLDTLAGDIAPFPKRLERIAREQLAALSLDLLAKKLDMSKRTMSRRFVDELQVSPGKWIQEKRLQAARSLLENTTLSISQICSRVGYEDVASFSRLFSRTTGMTPGAFRRQIGA